jgi:hypothetical protein
MNRRAQFVFLALIVAQAAHSIEEYTFRLYDVFTPARLASEFVSSDRAFGFAILNAALFALGVWCYMFRIRGGAASARAWAWPWIAIETANGIVHPAVAIARGGYFPGTGTAPLLLLLAVYLAVQLTRPAATGRA